MTGDLGAESVAFMQTVPGGRVAARRKSPRQRRAETGEPVGTETPSVMYIA